MKQEEFLKEELKAQFEFLKIYSIFLIGLVTAVGGMTLSESYSKNMTNTIVFITSIIALVFVSVIFLVYTTQIRRILKQLKKLKP